MNSFFSFRKFKKLLKKPRNFFYDSKVNKFAKVYNLNRLAKHMDITTSDSIIDFKQRTRALISSNCEVVYIKAIPGEREVIITTPKYEGNLSKTLEEIGRLGIEVAFGIDGKLTKNLKVLEIFNIISKNKIVNIRFACRKTKVKSYFQIQNWEDSGDYIVAPSANMISRKLWRQTIESKIFFTKGSQRYLHEVLGGVDTSELQESVDYVFTWVNSLDPDWQVMYSQYNPKFKSDANSLSRFVSRDELMYALRAIETYAPWIRKVHVVSNCKAPAWLNLSNPRVNWVGHDQIFDEKDLPTFSSHSIEACLHRIPSLSNYFIYSNDDFILSRPVSKSDFFESNGNCKIKLESWGNVNGACRQGDPDYLNAARNCQELLFQTFGTRPSQLHCHAPQAMRVDIIKEMEAEYEEQFRQTSSNKFRNINDIAVTGFLMHHYAYLSGRGVKDYTPTLLIQRNHDYKNRFSKILEQKGKMLFSNSKRYLSFCVNDGADSHLDDDWNISVQDFLDSYLPKKSSFEND